MRHMRLARRWAVVTTAVAVATTLAGPAVHAAPGGEIRGLNGPNAIKDSYLVVLKDQGPVGDLVATLSAQVGAKVKHTYKKSLRGFSATMPEAAARLLAASPLVAYVQQDKAVKLSGEQSPTPSWGLDRIDQASLPLNNSYTYPNEGAGVTAYIVDTGIRASHSDFGGRVVDQIDFHDQDYDASDCDGHGTHVAGTVGGSDHGVAKKVDLVAVRVMNCEGSGANSDIIAAIDWITETAPRPAVVNLSLGSDPDGAFDDAVRYSIESGITYAIAAGNDYGVDACTLSPARVEEAITVGATTRTDSRANYSNIGSCLDIFAPGSSITSASHTGDHDTQDLSGTSMATPHVAGAAALYLAEHPDASPQEVRDALVGTASSVVSNAGNGSPDKLLHVGGDATADCAPVANDEDLEIPDTGTASSWIWIEGCERARTDSDIAVHIVHPYRGDLTIELITPSGEAVSLKAADQGDDGENVDVVYTGDLSGETEVNGDWELRVTDDYDGDAGYVDSWTLDL